MNKITLVDVLKEVGFVFEEVLEELRKEVPQTYYVVRVEEDAKIFDKNKNDFIPVPKEFVGFWKMDSPTDLVNISLSSFLKNSTDEDWVKTKRIEVLKWEWD